MRTLHLSFISNSDKMKLFIKRVSFFSIIAASIYGVLLCGFIQLDWRPSIHTNLPESSTTSRMFRDLEKADTIDLLFIGSSHSYRGFNPSVFDSLGWQSFNMGTSSQTPRHSLILLKNYIDRMKLKILVVEVYLPVFSTSLNMVEPNLSILSNAPFYPGFAALFGLAWDIRMFNLFFKSVLVKLTKGQGFNPQVVDLPGEHYITKGYVERRDRMKYSEQVESSEIQIDSLQIAALREIISLAVSRNIQVKLIQMPVTQNLYNSFVNNAEFDRLMSSFASYHNLNGKVSLTDTVHFYDSNHLNSEGVRQLNPLLVSIIGQPAR
jgi:hypothetical protein